MEYFASSPFVSHPSDTPPNQPFDDILLSMGDMESRIDKTVDIGDLTLVNNGQLDDWLERAWQGHGIKLWLGDISWRFSDFQLVVDGINGGIAVPRSDRLRFTFYDQSERLNQPIQQNMLTDNNPKPITLGICRNIEPVLVDPAFLVYQVHDGAVESVVVRDNGIEITPSNTDLQNGKFTLGSPAAGKITCDVVEQHKTAAGMVQYLAGRVGITSFNQSSFSAFPAPELGYHARNEGNGR